MTAWPIVPDIDPVCTTRREFLERVDATLDRSGSACVLYVDLDSFHLVNLHLGEEGGDEVLARLPSVLLAAALEAVPGVSAWVVRAGGDEFALFVPGADAEATESLSGGLRAAAGRVLDTAGVPGPLAASVGVGHSRAGGSTTASHLLEQAARACRTAKRAGPGAVAAVGRETLAAGMAQARVAAALVQGLARHELVVHLQPIVDLRRGTTVAAECLVRWQHPERGLLAPGAFLPAAVDAGLMGEIGTAVLERGLAAARALGPSGPRVWVNLAAEQMAHPDTLVADVAGACDRHGVARAQVGFEITESAALADEAAAAEALGRLRRAGHGVGIDDFGTGYASLAYLRTYPATELKIDRSFVSGSAGPSSDPDAGLADPVMVRAATELGHTVGLEVVAEGVETVAQLQELRDLGVEYGQGYWFTPAVELDRLAELAGQAWCGQPDPS